MYFALVEWTEVRRAAAADGVAMIPMGSLEAHGPHLPCGTDTLQIDEIIRRAVEKTNDPQRVVVFPTIEYSMVEWARPFASAGISPVGLIDTLVSICKDALRLGFHKIIFVQGHVGLAIPQVAMWQLRHEGHYALYADTTPYLMAAEKVHDLTGETIAHGGIVETSLMLALAPESVDLSKVIDGSRAVDGPADLWGYDFPYPSLKGRPGATCIPTIEALPDAVEGLATQASAGLGEELFEIYAEALAEVLTELLTHPVPEAFLRPYHKPLD